MLKRLRVAEIMDDPTLDRELHLAALRGLERLNAISNSASLLAGPIEQLARSRAHLVKPLKILDVACGAGDLAIQLSSHFDRRALKVLIHGLDISELAVSYAEKNKSYGPAEKNCSFSQLDVLQQDLPRGYDVIMTSLFTHHLDPPQIEKLMTKMAEAAEALVLVNDLERSYTSLWSVIFATRLLTTSPVVHHDGPASVRAAFTADEMLEMSKNAGLIGAQIKKIWPCRILLSWVKTNDAGK